MARRRIPTQQTSGVDLWYPNCLYFVSSTDNSNACAQRLLPNELQAGLQLRDAVDDLSGHGKVGGDVVLLMQAQIHQFFLAPQSSRYLSTCAAKSRCSISTSSYSSHMCRQSPRCSGQHSPTCCRRCDSANLHDGSDEPGFLQVLGSRYLFTVAASANRRISANWSTVGGGTSSVMSGLEVAGPNRIRIRIKETAAAAVCVHRHLLES